jgi:hypothetical protein
MKIIQSSLRFNESLDRLYCGTKQSSACHRAAVSGVPNARINPAGRIVASIQVLRMKIKLHRLGFNELLGSVIDMIMQVAIRFFALLLCIQLD